MKPDHVKKFEESISYPEYTEEDKKRGMNNKDLDFMTKNPMYWAVFLPSLFVIGFTMGGLNYMITILQARTRGMTLMRMPLTVWGIFTATVLAMLAFPALLVSAIMMTLDKVLQTSFFMPTILKAGEVLEYGGGSPILFQHLFQKSLDHQYY